MCLTFGVIIYFIFQGISSLVESIIFCYLCKLTCLAFGVIIYFLLEVAYL